MGVVLENWIYPLYSDMPQPHYEMFKSLKDESQDAGPAWVTQNIFWASHKIISLVLGCLWKVRSPWS